MNDRTGLLMDLIFSVSYRIKKLVNIPEKDQVKEQVDNEQSRKYQAGIIMHGYPLVTGDTKE